MSAPKQQTLASSATVTGTSLHTGEQVKLTLKPAPVDHGIKFRRIDLDDQPFIDAHVSKVQTVERAKDRAMQNGGRHAARRLGRAQALQHEGGGALGRLSARARVGGVMTTTYS